MAVKALVLTLGGTPDPIIKAIDEFAPSAGLAMAAAPYGCSFDYTGGDRRDKDGLGIVCSGSDKFCPEVNVFDLLAVEERRLIAAFFNTARFAAAWLVAEQAAEKARPDRRICLRALARITRGCKAGIEAAIRRACDGMDRQLQENPNAGRDFLAARLKELDHRTS